MLKLLGSLCILAGGALARWLDLAGRRRKRDTLSDLLSALQRMGETVRMARTPLPILLNTLARDCGPEAASFFSGTANAARRGESLPEAWRSLAERLPLDGTDRGVIASLGCSLQGDEEMVCKAVSAAVSRLSGSLEETRQKRAEEEKRATALWFSAAALLVILLI